MTAELKKMSPGALFQPKAADWNEFVDAALANRSRQADQTPGRSSSSSGNGIVRLRNDSGADMDQFAPVSLDTLLITPDDNEDEFRSLRPVFSGAAVTTDNISKPFGILQEPLKQDVIGKAMVTGVTPAIIAVSDESHAFAELAAAGLQSAASGIVRILWKESGTGSKWALIHFPAGGGSSVSCVPAKIVSGTSPYTVDVYANGYDQAATSTGATAEVLMLNYAETLTAGTKVLALLAKTNVTGGEDVV